MDFIYCFFNGSLMVMYAVGTYHAKKCLIVVGISKFMR